MPGSDTDKSRSAGGTRQGNRARAGPVGDLKKAGDVSSIAHILAEAAKAMMESQMLQGAFGEDVINHHYHAARWEIEEQNGGHRLGIATRVRTRVTDGTLEP